MRELFAETDPDRGARERLHGPLTRALLALATQEISTPLGAFSFAPRLNTSAALCLHRRVAISMIVFGLEPAFALTRRRAARARLPKACRPSAPAEIRRQRAFIRWQVAISVCFFLMAATLTRTVAALVMHDSGIAVDELADRRPSRRHRRRPTRRLRRALDRAAESRATAFRPHRRGGHHRHAVRSLDRRRSRP